MFTEANGQITSFYVYYNNEDNMSLFTYYSNRNDMHFHNLASSCLIG